MTLQWVSSDLRTGRVLADLPGFEPVWPLRRTIGKYETATGKLHLDGAPGNWPDALLEGRAVLHVYDDADTAMTPIWSAIVTQQIRDTSQDYVEVALATSESYFDRRFTGDVEYDATGQNTIVADLITAYIVDTVNAPGLPISTVQVTSGVGTARDKTYNDTDNATVYSRLQSLMGMAGGPEWTIEWVWAADRQHITPVLYVGDRIGQAAGVGLSPATTWSLPGAVQSARQVRDYTSGKGGNVVTAFGPGQGSITPTSGPVAAADFQGRPTYEYRWQPSNSETDPTKLTEWAHQAVALLGPGAITLALVADLATAPKYGSQWRIGDDFGYDIGDQPMFPGGLVGTGRCISYELAADTIAPILFQSSVYVEPTG